ncbi:phage tail protein [Nocardioides stalactiti]|uniref:phage tail protein n=1 Tax=Nocardioides stalactiti TaxID=2755356 RepID=UPI00160111AD|nr:hypothetical protein [Nocardioides stalactiti]
MASTSVVFDILARDRASDKFDRLGNSADRSNSKLSKLGGVAKTAAKTGVLAIAAGSIIAGKALFDMTKGAIEDQAAQTKLATALKNNTGATKTQVAAVEDWISAQGKALGITDDELRPALGRLAQATKDVDEAQKLTALSMDVAAGSGASMDSVSKALTKAYNGNVAGLAKFGIKTKNAAGETISFEEAQKRLARTFKGQAEKNANTLSGKMQRLKVMLAEAGEEIGAKLIPVVTKMADWFLKKGLPAIEAFGRYLGEKVPPIFDRIRGVIDKFSGDGSGKLAGFVADVKGIFSDGIAILQNLWRLFGDNIVRFLKSTFANVKTVLSGAFDVIKGGFKTVSALLKGDWKKAWDGIKLIVRGAGKIVVGLVRQLFNLVKFAFKNAGVILKKTWSVMWEGIKILAKKGADWLRDKIRELPGAIKALAGKFRDAGSSIMSKLWDVVKDKARDGADFIVDKIREIPGKIRGLVDKFKEAGGALIGGIAKGIQNAAGFASDFAGQIWSAVKGAINSGIDQLNNLLEFDFKVKGIGISVNAPDIGHLARGTNHWRGGLTVVGEEGPELVNLPRGSQVHTAAATRAMAAGLGGGSGQPLVVQLVLPNGRVIEQILIEHQRTTGRPLQVKTLGPAA